MSTGSATPKSDKLEQSSFSPISVRESPVTKTPQRGNLTGNARKIRDSAADLFNLIQEWNNLHLSGLEILQKINILKSTSMNESGVIDPNKCYPDGLQDLCDELDKTCVNMSDVLGRMQATKTEVGGVIKLEELKQTSEVPLFLTWPAHRFGETWNLVLKAYETELSLKKTIKENVAHTRTEANLVFYIASWIYQPYVDTETDLAVEALLKETGHR